MGVGVGVDGVSSLAPVEPNIAELCAQETLTAKCLGTVYANDNFETSCDTGHKGLMPCVRGRYSYDTVYSSYLVSYR